MPSPHTKTSTGSRRSSRRCHSAPGSISSSRPRSPISSSLTGLLRRPRWQATRRCARHLPRRFRCSPLRCIIPWARLGQPRCLQASQLPWHRCREYFVFKVRRLSERLSTYTYYCSTHSFIFYFGPNPNLPCEMMISSRMSRTLRIPDRLFFTTTFTPCSQFQSLLYHQRIGILFSKAVARTSGSLTLHGLPQMIGVPLDFNGMSNTFPMQSIQTNSPGKELVNYCIDVPNQIGGRETEGKGKGSRGR